jgi:GntR family transcriptional repressor for pyruvate dehydrogenase complex
VVLPVTPVSSERGQRTDSDGRGAKRRPHVARPERTHSPPGSPKSISGSTLADLIEGTFLSDPPGRRLPSERQLAGHFEVGRPLVREALRTLSERGLIEVQAGRGIFVRRVLPVDAARPVDNLLRRQAITPRQLVEARSMLEGEASQLACTRATERDLRHLSELVAAGAKPRNLPARVRNDLEFHLSVVRAAHNPVIETMFAAILRPTAEMMLRSLSDPHVSRKGLPYHEHLYLAISDRDPRAAVQASRDHLRVSERTYGRDFDISLEILALRRLGVSDAAERERSSLDDLLSSVLKGL